MAKGFEIKTMRGYLPFLLIAITLAFALTDVLTIYQVGGINWDFVAEVLYAKSLTTPSFYSALLGGHLNASISYGDAFYFEMIRPPLIGILMVPFYAAAGSSFIPLYLAFVLLLLLFSIIYFSRAMGLDSLLITLLFFTPYMIFFFLMLNGSEIVATAFVLISITLVLKRKWESGMLLAISGMAKYNAMIFVFLIALLPAKQRLKAFISFVLTSVPWLVFNTIVFHSPIASYLVSMSSFAKDRAGIFNTQVIADSLKLMLPDLIPALLILLGLLILWYLLIGKESRKNKVKLPRFPKLDYKNKVVLAVLLFGFIGWLFAALSGSMNDLPRESYLIYLGIALVLGVMITGICKLKLKPLPRNLPIYVTFILFIITIGMLISAYNSIFTNYVFGTYGSTDPIWATVGNTMSLDGLGNCNVVSNYWPYLVYSGIKAHSPYFYNYTVEHYPIVFLYNITNSPINFRNVTKTLNYTNFSIMFPRNWSCG